MKSITTHPFIAARFANQAQNFNADRQCGACVTSRSGTRDAGGQLAGLPRRQSQSDEGMTFHELLGDRANPLGSGLLGGANDSEADKNLSQAKTLNVVNAAGAVVAGSTLAYNVATGGSNIVVPAVAMVAHAASSVYLKTQTNKMEAEKKASETKDV